MKSTISIILSMSILMISIFVGCNKTLVDYYDEDGNKLESFSVIGDRNIGVGLQYLGTNWEYQDTVINKDLEENIQTRIMFDAYPNKKVYLSECHVELKDSAGTVIPYNKIMIQSEGADDDHPMVYKSEDFINNKSWVNVGSHYVIYYLYGDTMDYPEVNISVKLSLTVDGTRKDFNVNKKLKRKTSSEIIRWFFG